MSSDNLPGVVASNGTVREARVWASGDWTRVSIILAQPSDVPHALQHIVSCAKQIIATKQTRSALAHLLATQEEKLSGLEARTSAGGAQQGTDEERALLAALKQADLLMRSIAQRTTIAVGNESVRTPEAAVFANANAQEARELLLVTEQHSAAGEAAMPTPLPAQPTEELSIDGVAYEGLHLTYATNEELFALFARCEGTISFALPHAQDKRTQLDSSSSNESSAKRQRLGEHTSSGEEQREEQRASLTQARDPAANGESEDDWERMSAATSTSLSTAAPSEYVNVSRSDAQSRSSPQPSEDGSVVRMEQLRSGLQRLLTGSQSGASATTEEFDSNVPASRASGTRTPVGAYDAGFFAAASLAQPGQRMAKQRHGVSCEMCSEEIRGVRWTCLSCPSWNSCEECYGVLEDAHPEHSFVRVARPQDFYEPLDQRPIFHLQQTCTACEQPIIGALYRCASVDCKNVRLCEACEAKPKPYAHPHTHPLLKYRLPEAQSAQSNLLDETALDGLLARIMAGSDSDEVPDLAKYLVAAASHDERKAATLGPKQGQYSRQSRTERLEQHQGGQTTFSAQPVSSTTTGDEEWSGSQVAYLHAGETSYGSKLEPRQVFCHSWTIAVGARGLPSKLLLKRITPACLSPTFSEVKIPSTTANSVVELSISNLCAPSEPGTYEEVWQLFDSRDREHGLPEIISVRVADRAELKKLPAVPPCGSEVTVLESQIQQHGEAWRSESWVTMDVPFTYRWLVVNDSNRHWPPHMSLKGPLMRRQYQAEIRLTGALMPGFDRLGCKIVFEPGLAPGRACWVEMQSCIISAPQPGIWLDAAFFLVDGFEKPVGTSLPFFLQLTTERIQRPPGSFEVIDFMELGDSQRAFREAAYGPDESTSAAAETTLPREPSDAENSFEERYPELQSTHDAEGSASVSDSFGGRALSYTFRGKLPRGSIRQKRQPRSPKGSAYGQQSEDSVMRDAES